TPWTDTYVQHFDRCLGCMACVTACPSGVQYDKLIEATRPQIERHYPRSLPDKLFRRLLFALFPYPNRLRLLAVPLLLYQASGLRSALRRSGLLDHLPARLRAMESILPPITPAAWRSLPRRTRPRGTPRRRVGLLRPMQGHLRRAGRVGTPCPAPPAIPARRLPRCLPPPTRSGHPRPTPPRPQLHPRPRTGRNPRIRPLLRLGRHLQSGRAAS